MTQPLNRRHALFAGAGILAVGNLPSGKVFAADADPLGKELDLLTTSPGRNGGPDLERLVESWMTPTKLFYVRSHAPNPTIDPASFRLKVEGAVRNEVSFSLDELKNRFTKSSIIATLTCAGNRREEYNQIAKVGGVQWGSNAIGNAKWTGVPLAEILGNAEPLENARHVWFEGLDAIERDSGTIPFGGSIPMEKAMSGQQIPGALITYMMNDEELPPDHGYPLRTIVPGYIGARSVKWLGKIVVSDRPSPNHYLQKAYKIIRDSDPIDWTEAGPIYRYPINGAIASTGGTHVVKPGKRDLIGYVLPSGRVGSRVRQVSLSADGGATWVNAQLTGTNSDFCWQLWRGTVNVTAKTDHLLMRARDTAGDFMPPEVRWNAKGYLQNSWFRLPIQVEA